MLLSELTSVSLCAIVTLAYYLWYEKIKCNTTVTAKPSIICHSQFKFGCRLGFDRALCKSTVTLLIQVVAAVVESNSAHLLKSGAIIYLCLTYIFVLGAKLFYVSRMGNMTLKKWCSEFKVKQLQTSSWYKASFWYRVDTASQVTPY